MKKKVLFIHGGDVDGFEVGGRLVASLKKELGSAYEMYFPKMHDDEKHWLKQIGKEIEDTIDETILVGHSLGASMLLKYAAENKIEKNITGIFLIAPPFWSGSEEWVQPLKLHKEFPDKLPKDIPVYFYQCKDDEVVPAEHFRIYKQKIPWAVFRDAGKGGHVFNYDLAMVAKDIQKL